MEGLLHVHDSIAEREPLPVGNLPEEEVLDRVTNYPEESVKIVRIDKTNEPLVRWRRWTLHLLGTDFLKFLVKS